ncbi:MAG: DUF2007 domain-containing protein [Bacteroidetes bacterium]|jgi:hypothetical protein|nr:DUF2007 domain-containing protein [Bacteroidota bacterium]MBU1577925.1 DUF2007 domain-containing protein [Bacteroidota bacterium]MBU2558588.1 DUF2007 domain-containing protein [Bacteroidota bacterium]MDA3943836.1 DUF2007-related protein [Bacteroidota bacterium]
MKTKKTNDLIEVFAGTFLEAAMVKSLLQDAAIAVFLKDEHMGTIAPWHVSAGGAAAVKLIINSDDYEKAKLIIEKYEQSKQ